MRVIDSVGKTVGELDGFDVSLLNGVGAVDAFEIEIVIGAEGKGALGGHTRATEVGGTEHPLDEDSSDLR